MNVLDGMELLQGFVNYGQLRALIDGCRGEEGEFFRGKLIEYGQRIKDMPKTYDTGGMGGDAVAHLHYFMGGMDWYITEKDCEAEQLQAFGLADLGMGHPETGYICIREIVSCGAELDLHWRPRPLKECRPELFANRVGVD